MFELTAFFRTKLVLALTSDSNNDEEFISASAHDCAILYTKTQFKLGHP